MTGLALTVKSIEEIPAAAAEILGSLIRGDRKKVAFKADMGAGKTTLISAILRAMGIEESVASPTFAIVNEYESAQFGRIYHYDFYRLNSISEALDIGVDEVMDSDSWCFMEWPEKIGNLLPADCVMVKITTEENGTRLIEVEL